MLVVEHDLIGFQNCASKFLRVSQILLVLSRQSQGRERRSLSIALARRSDLKLRWRGLGLLNFSAYNIDGGSVLNSDEVIVKALSRSALLELISLELSLQLGRESLILSWLGTVGASGSGCALAVGRSAQISLL